MSHQFISASQSDLASLTESQDQNPKFYYRKQKDSSAKPKNRSAYMIFSASVRAEWKQQGVRLSGNQGILRISELWRTLSQEDHERYNAEAVTERAAYKAWKAENPQQSTHNRTKTNHVKKSRSAYAFFAQENYHRIKQSQPSLYSAGIYQIIGQEWAKLDEIQRIPYQKQAEEDKKQKQEELAKCDQSQLCKPRKSSTSEEARRQGSPSKKVKSYASTPYENSNDWFLGSNEGTPVSKEDSFTLEQEGQGEYLEPVTSTTRVDTINPFFLPPSSPSEYNEPEYFDFGSPLSFDRIPSFSRAPSLPGLKNFFEKGYTKPSCDTQANFSSWDNLSLNSPFDKIDYNWQN